MQLRLQTQKCLPSVRCQGSLLLSPSAMITSKNVVKSVSCQIHPCIRPVDVLHVLQDQMLTGKTMLFHRNSGGNIMHTQLHCIRVYVGRGFDLSTAWYVSTRWIQHAVECLLGLVDASTAFFSTFLFCALFCLMHGLAPTEVAECRGGRLIAGPCCSGEPFLVAATKVSYKVL